jgi:hypothetical protein
MCVVFLGYPLMRADEAAAVHIPSGCVAFMASTPVLYDLRQEDENIEAMPLRNNYTQYFQEEMKEDGRRECVT